MFLFEPVFLVGGRVPVFVVAFCCLLGAGHAARSYWRDVDTMEQQASQFTFAQSTCACCPVGEGCDKPYCDRRILFSCIASLFGSLASFEEQVRTRERKALSHQLRNRSITYSHIVQATLPGLWLACDFMSRWPAEEALVELAETCTDLLVIYPFAVKIALRLTHALRARCGRACLDFMVSVAVTAVGVFLVGLPYLVHAFVVQEVISSPLNAQLTTLGLWSIPAILLWQCLPDLQPLAVAPSKTDSGGPPDSTGGSADREDQKDLAVNKESL